MDVRCDECQARYRIDDARIGPEGLAVRCGKCGSTFLATRAHAAAPPAITSAKPAAPPPKAAPGPAAAPAGTAAKTMMFAPATPAPPQGATQSRAGTIAAVAKPPVAAGATMLFGGAPAAGGKDVAAGPAFPAAAFGAPTAIPAATVVQEPSHSMETASEAARAEEKPSPAPRGPPRAAIIAVVSAIAVVFVLAAVVAVKKLGRRGPPRAAIEQLAEAQSLAEKDAIASLGEAEAQANAALLAASDAPFPQAHATLAQIQVQWADALTDQAWFWGETANRAVALGDDRKKGEAEAKAIALQDAAKSRLKAAFESAAAGNKMDSESPDVALALADYYRAARSRVNLGRELKRAALLKADAGRIAFLEGADFAAREDGGPKAVEKLRVALAAAPQSARIHFRLAMAYLAMHQEGDAKRELLETLRLSSQHERGKLVLELVTAQSAAKAASPSEGDKR